MAASSPNGLDLSILSFSCCKEKCLKCTCSELGLSLACRVLNVPRDGPQLNEVELTKRTVKPYSSHHSTHMSSIFLPYATSAINFSRLDTCLRNDSTVRIDHVCLQQRSTSSRREQRILTLRFENVASESFGEEFEIGDAHMKGACWVCLRVATTAPMCAGLANRKRIPL